MSVFDKLRGGGGPAKISSKAAMLLGCILMASADGEVDDDELAIVRRLDGHGSTENWDTAVRAFKRNDRSTCFNMVCDSINSDHVMPFLANLVERLIPLSPGFQDVVFEPCGGSNVPLMFRHARPLVIRSSHVAPGVRGAVSR